MTKIRDFCPGDEAALRAVYYSAIHLAASRDYSPAQLAAWAPRDDDEQGWAARMQALRPYVVEQHAQPVAYADLQDDGLIDHFFVSGLHGGQGLGSLLMQHIHQQAARRGIATLHAHVSLRAEGFFARHGFVLIRRQRPVRNGLALDNAFMSKTLSSAG